MNNENKSSSNSTPFVIIGLVLLAVIVGGWWFYSSSTTQAVKSNANKKTDSAASSVELYSKAAPGANPPNSLGPPSAPLTLEEFADFQCPTCAGMHPVVKEIRAAYGDRVRIIFREYPLNIPAHDKAYDAAVAAEAAGLQGKFWDMQNLLFSNQQTWARSSDYKKIYDDYAQKLGLDVEKFDSDMAGIVAKNRVDADLQRGRSLNINGTPTFYLNGKMLGQESLTSEGMRQIVEAELQKTQSK